MSNLSWVLLLGLWSSGYAQQQSRCYDDANKPIYSPCYCVETGEGNLDITCIGVDHRIIKDTFLNSVEPEINRFALVPFAGQFNQLNINADLLSDKRARVIDIASCPIDASRSLQIDPDAFRSSSDYAERFSITECDVNQVNWSFLSDFRELTDIQFTNVDGIQSINSIPALNNIKQLSFADCMGFSNLLEFPAKSLMPLETLVLNGNKDLGSEVVSNIMLTLANNAVQLGNFTLINSPLVNQVPQNIGDILTLKSINLSSNLIGSVKSDAFTFADDVSVRLIDLSNNLVRTISASAFSQGDYGDAIIRLDNNLLTKFESSIFLEVLDEMNASGGSGIVSIANNRIVCVGCDLAWLIRDNPNLLQWVSGGACLDGTAFDDIDPGNYDSTCAVITPSPVTTSTTELSTTEVSTTEIPPTETSTTITPTTETSTTVTPVATTPTSEASTTNNPITEVPTTQSTAITNNGTTFLPTTIQPNNNEDLQLLLLYITLGLVAVSVLILIFSCIYMVYYRKTRKNRRKSSVVETIDKSDNLHGFSVVPNSNPAPGMPGPRPIVVQGPGGNWYKSSVIPPNTNVPAANVPVKTKKQGSGQKKSTLRDDYY